MPEGQAAAAAATSKPLDSRLVTWLAIQVILDARARLVEAGAGAESRIELAKVFVDLPVKVVGGAVREPDSVSAVKSLCAENSAELVAVPQCSERGRMAQHPTNRWLLVGGPGSGKTTVGTMVAQLLRVHAIGAPTEKLPENVRERYRAFKGALDDLAKDLAAPTACFPIRLALPTLAAWLGREGRDSANPTEAARRFLEHRLAGDFASQELELGTGASEVQRALEASGPVFWIFDGLDEVPPSADRKRVIDAARAMLREGDRLLVATRPQGYGGEFNELCALVLQPMGLDPAKAYGKRLLRAWDPDGEGHQESLDHEFSKAEVEELIQTPLHATMAALLVAESGTLPAARWLLLDHYFNTIFKRELKKRGAHNIAAEDGQFIRELHARAGLALHVRAQENAGVDPSLSRRECRALLEEMYKERGFGLEERERFDTMLRFTFDRLVLLLQVSEARYGFGIRSLQEFFAAEALLMGDWAKIPERVRKIALNPHWSNVLGLIVSEFAIGWQNPHQQCVAKQACVGLCRALNDGALGRPASLCLMGSRIALSMLREIERYGQPWLTCPLWDIAMEAARRAQVDPMPVPTVGYRQGYDSAPLGIRLGMTVANWNGPQPRRQALLDAAERLLSGSEGENLKGQILLHGLLRRGDRDAETLAGDHPPRRLEDAMRLHAAATWGDGPSHWLKQFEEQHPDWFTPEWEGSIPGRAPLRVRLECGVELGICALSGKTDAWFRLRDHSPQAGPVWDAWRRVAQFHIEPSRHSLADALEGAAAPEAYGELSRAARLCAWPLAACLHWVANGPELLDIATNLRAGAMGTEDDWRCAETRWLDRGVTTHELRGCFYSHLPWESGIAKEGFVALPILSASGDFAELSTILIPEIDALGSRAERAARLLSVMAWWGPAGLPLTSVRALLGIGGQNDVVDPFDLARILPDLSGNDAEEWFRIIDERGKSNRCTMRGRRVKKAAEMGQALIDHLARHSERCGLESAIVAVLGTGTDLDLSPLGGLGDAPALPPHLRAARTILRLLVGSYEPHELASLMGTLRPADSDEDGRAVLARILLNATRLPPGFCAKLLVEVLEASTELAPKVEAQLLGALLATLHRSAPPQFLTEPEWTEHALPKPFLGSQPAPRAPWRIVELRELTNVRLFGTTPQIDAPLPVPAPGEGQWIMLVGENGTGKTTLLRSLALALCSPVVGSKLLDERLPFARNGGEGRIQLELDSGTFSVSVRRLGSERLETVQELEAAGERPWVVGYGVRRGNARGEKDREPDRGPVGELHTLFDRPASLYNAVDWLKELDRQVLREQKASSTEPVVRTRSNIWRNVERALQALLSITKLDPGEDHIFVEHPRFGHVRLDALSDGYLTTTGWVVDMIARWVERQRELDEPIGPDLLREMKGFVLIDEIDLHLHPVWQMRIVDDLRRLFPCMSFIATTHNPLALQGMRRGETFIMRYGDEGRIELCQRDIMPGHDVDRVLLEQFGVEHTFDKETRDLLRRHRELLQAQAEPDNPERVEVEDRLAERLGTTGGAVVQERAGRQRPPRLEPHERDLLTRFLKKK